ncbi:hypothetical protein P8935_16580 [Telmatobacter sp. DSM 110680]|uniref:Uncharacterized protein n=1 Tax=Telmatobacter sp. DSM 110680 TaxID=3036704 RepID=A0AAU7DFM5_9BACT
MAVTGLPLGGLNRSVTDSLVHANRCRHISPQAGRALEILGHAIEYLTDEYLQEAEEISAHDPNVQAIQLLMALNREIYYACPLQPTFTERVRGFFHLALR